MKSRLQDAIAQALSSRGVDAPPEKIVVEHPADISHGDYATSVALKYAKELSLSPRDLAEHIVAALGTIEGVAEVSIAGPGFINFKLDGAALAASLERARSEDMWGANGTLKREEVLLEYTSPNLFKPLHIGNLVGNILGESVSRLLQFSGATVRRINYPSDIGLTVAKGVWGLQRSGGNPKDIKALGEAYRMGNDAYESDPSAKAEIDAVNKALYEGDAVLNAIRKEGVGTSLAHLDAICKQLGTTFDLELFESEAGPIGRDIVLAHVGAVFQKSDGAIIFPGEEHGLHTRVFINSAGLPTYEAKDIGNFKLKTDKYPSWSRYIVVTGVEQLEYFKVLIAAIRQVFPEAASKALMHIPTGFLTLTTGKMSSRKGNVLTGESLLLELAESARERAAESRADDIEALAENVATAAIKYQILKQGSGKNIVFDKDKSLSLEGDSGPYLQYAHARTEQIVEKAAADGVTAAVDADAEAGDIVRLVHRFPEMVEFAAEKYEPHIVANYLTTLAAAFNRWYAEEHILDGTPRAAHKVAVTDAVRRTLKNGLWILGIPAPEKM